MTLDMEFELDVPFDMQFGDWLPASPSSQDAVLYIPQKLTKDEQEQARKNIGAAKEEKEIAYLYTTFSVAVADLNASTTENADATDENAVCAIYTDSDGNTNLMLLKDIELTESIEFTVPVIFDLNSYEVKINGDYRIRLRADNSIIDGRNGGQIIKETAINSVYYCLYFNGNNCKLLGGYYRMTAPADDKLIACVMANGESFLIDGAEKIHTEVTSGTKSTYCVVGQKDIRIINSVITGKSLSANIYAVNAQSKENTAFIINSEISVTLESEISDTAAYALSGHKISVEKSKISAQTTNNGVIGINAASDLTISDCEVYIDSETGSGQCLTIQSGCTADVENSTFFADGTTGSVAEGNENYAGTQGIANEGTLTLKNCNVYGTHAGLQCGSSAITKINGGLYEGPGHGGIYVCTVSPGQFYAENCTVRAVPYRGKHKEMYFYGNNMYVVAAVYIGCGNGIKAYFDNCVMDGGGPERMPDYELDGTFKGYMGAEPIRFRQSNDEKNNSAYISNCTLMGDGKIRFANATHSLHLGFYNRILCEPSLESCMVDEGRVVYTGYEEFRTV